MAILLLTASAVSGQGPQRKWTAFAYPATFEHLSVERGLSQSTVNCILQDRKGFLWFGTDAGLNRYDGFRFQVFHPDRNTPNSLSGDWILSLLEDHRGYLWVGTRNGGLTILDPETMVMVPVLSSEEPGGLRTRSVSKLVEDRDGNVWIGSETHGLTRVSKDWRMPERPTFEKFVPSFFDPTGAPEWGVTALFCDAKGSLWIACRERGLGRLLAEAEHHRLVFEYRFHYPAYPETSAPNGIHAIAEDPFGLLWLGCDAGVFTFDPERRSFQHCRTVLGKSDSKGNEHRALSILRDSAGTMWVASDGQGLLKALPRASGQDPVRFQSFTYDALDSGSLSGNGLQCLFEDRSGVLWASAYQGGLNKLVLNPGKHQARESPSLFQYRSSAANPTSLSGNIVATMGEDCFGNLWIGTDGFGLNRVRPPSRPGERLHFERFREDPGHGRGTLQSNVILTTHLDPEQRLWFGTYNAGLVRVDQASATARPTFTHFRSDPGNPETLASNFIRCIVDDGSGGFWVAQDGTGLNHFDPRTGKARRYAWGDGPKFSSSEAIYRIVRDGFGTLWLATPAGLNRFNPVTEEFRVYKPGGPHSLSDASVNTLYADATGTLWVGTSGGGLNRMSIPPWNGPEPQFQAYGVRHGLPGNAIKSILPGGPGELWLATGRALCRFNIQEGRAHPLPWQRELQKAEFIWNASYCSPSGELCLGSNDGLTIFHPDELIPNKVISPIAITDFQVLHKSMPLWARRAGGSQGGQPEITLSPKDSNIFFDFAALHFVAPEQNQFAFMLEGLDLSWKEADNNHSVSYTTLPPGNYVLRVKAANCDGVWNEQGLRLTIHVQPPFYRTAWFLILSVLAVLGAGLGLHRFRVRMHVRSERELQGRIQEALAHIQALHGLLPVCAWCKKIRDDAGHWRPMEDYIAEHSQAEFSHGICPECKQHVAQGPDDPPPE